jgi:hypothetical protein
MSTNRCKTHLRRDCSTCKTGIYAPRAASRTQDENPLTDPQSPLHQATFYGGADTSPSTPCESSSSSSSSYDSGSSSSSYDSGSSSYDSGC